MLLIIKDHSKMSRTGEVSLEGAKEEINSRMDSSQSKIVASNCTNRVLMACLKVSSTLLSKDSMKMRVARLH